jgi:flagellar motility protein MotE (MotC chaperone)
MNKKHIILISASAFLCFGAAFAFSFFYRKPFPEQSAAQSQQQSLTTPVETLDQSPGPLEVGTTQTTNSIQKRELAEKQLKILFNDVQEKIREYESKQQELQSREQRLQVTQETLKKDIEKLDNLRIDTAVMIASLKAQQESLNNSRVRIEQTEKANLITVAATYDKMDPASASQILTNLSKLPAQSAGAEGGLDEAVKILHYMTDRTKAKVLAELVGSEPTLAAVFCDRLKRINVGQ